MLSKHSFLHRSTALFLSLVMLLGLLPAPVRAEAAEDDRDLVIVSMGDSYSSGEGIEPFYHEKPSDLSNLSELLYYTPTEDWLAHRSTKAWGGQLVLGDILMSEHRYDPLDPVSDPHWFFVASSGAKSRHIEKPQLKLNTVDGSLYLADFNEIQTTLANADRLPDDIPHIPAQINVFDTLDSLGLKADYVTLTLGGNDVGFTNVVAEAAVTLEYLIPYRQNNLINDLRTKVERFWIDYAPGLQNAYLKILDRAGEQAHLIVAGYPLLFSEDENLLELFSVSARCLVNLAVNELNQKIQILVSNISELPDYKGKISFVSVAEAFSRHGAYSQGATDKDKPFINPVHFTLYYQDLDYGYEKPTTKVSRFSLSNLIKNLLRTSAYSMHPNENGAKVYAACVQEEIDRLETERLANAQSETVQPEDEQNIEIEYIVDITSDIILNYDIPILYTGTGRKIHSYYGMYNRMDINASGEPLAGLVLYWDEDMNEGRGAPTLSYVASETSVLVSFSCAPYSTSAIFDTTTNLWNELPENLSWSFGGNYFIGQSLSTDIHSTSYSTFIYDIYGNPFLEMHNMEYGQIIEYMGKPYFIYGDATSYSRVNDPYDPESTFSYDIYGIDLETGNITPVCSYTMYCSLWYFYLIQLTKDGLCIYDMDLQQTAVYDFTGGTITERGIITE